jgi:hypothetical protein
VVAVALGLAACTATVEGTATPGGPPDLGAALSLPVPGLCPVDPPPPPWQLCTTAPATRAPRLDPALGEPMAVGHAAEGTTLYADAWTTSAPMVAEAVLDQAETEAPDCASAPQPADAGAGARTARSVEDWTGSRWTGVTIRIEVPDRTRRSTRSAWCARTRWSCSSSRPGTSTTSDWSTTTWRRSPTDRADHFRQQLPLR